jgi:hypothetical protein
LILTRLAVCLAALALSMTPVMAKEPDAKQEAEADLAENWIKANHRVTLTAAEAQAFAIAYRRCQKEEPKWKAPWLDLSRSAASDEEVFEFICYTNDQESFFVMRFADGESYTRTRPGALVVSIDRTSLRVIETYYNRH